MKPMSRKSLVLLIATALAVVFLLAGRLLFIESGFDWVKERDTESAIDCVLEWGRLAPFPESAEHLTVTTEGGMFTRAFRVTFVASQEEIARWLTSSPGTRELTPERVEPSTRKYLIEPGGGAVYAEVVIDDETNWVSIYVCWS
jgi:hypothetical protein